MNILLDPCYTTTVTPSPVSGIVLKVWDALAYYPLSGAAYTEFTDSASTASGDPSLCPKTYTATIAPTPLTNFNLNAATRQFLIYSDSFSQVGTYTVTLRAEVILYPSKFATTSFTVTVQDPCLTTTLISLTPASIENLVAFAGYNTRSPLKYTFNDTESL